MLHFLESGARTGAAVEHNGGRQVAGQPAGLGGGGRLGTGVVAGAGDRHGARRSGLGLHLGWAIEGTIGSRFKIDASYLSPNVNVAARLEAATHQFGCPLLMSGFLVDEVSTTMNSASQGRPLCAAAGGVSVPRRRM